MTSLIIFYLFLFSFTFIIFRNAYKIWKIKHDFTLPISTLIIFYFTLAGAFIFPLDSFLGYKGTAIGLHYLAIFDRLFPVAFDYDYIISCAYYILFILVFQYTYILFVKRYIRINKIDFNQTKKLHYEVVINPYLVLAISFICIFISAYIMREEIHFAISHEKSIYIITRQNNNPYYTIHQLANEFSVLIPFIAYTFTIVKSNKFNIRLPNNKSSFYILLFACVVSSLYISCLGNRREILSGLVFCTLISLNQFKNIDFKRYGYIFCIVLTFFFANNFFRLPVVSRQLNAILHLEKSGNLLETEPDAKIDVKGTLASVVFSNELFYAHFSMYGVVHKNIPLTYGSSFVSLATSIIPRAIYPNRPKDIYQYYVESANAAPGQIYTIHHVAAYYLNFGVFGVILGGLVLGGFFIFSFFIDFYSFKRNGTFLILLKCLVPFLICGQLVTFITAGPEAYKAMVLEGVLIPVLLLRLCSKKNILSEN